MVTRIVLVWRILHWFSPPGIVLRTRPGEMNQCHNLHTRTLSGPLSIHTSAVGEAPAWKVGDRGFEPRFGIQVSKF